MFSGGHRPLKSMAALRLSARGLPWWVLPIVARALCPQPTPHSARLSHCTARDLQNRRDYWNRCGVLRRRFKACRTTSCYLVISFDLVWQMSRFAGVAWPAARPHLTACAHVPGSMALRVLTFAGAWQVSRFIIDSPRRRRHSPLP